MNPIMLYIVDNCLLNRIASKRYFSSDYDFEVVGDFSNAKECMEAMEKTPVDIILMDIELPQINGIEAIKIIKEKYPKTKVIIYSTYKNSLKILAALSCGACGYVLKNYHRSDINLKTIIKMIVNGAFWMDLEIADLAFSKIPKPNFNNFDEFYKEDNDLGKDLTKREKEVLRLLIDGKTNSQIAKEMIVSTNTAKAHVGSILAKLCVTDRTQAAVKAVRANLF